MEYLIKLADCQRRGGDNKGALNTTENILKKNASNTDAMEIRGLTLMNLGEFPEAGTIFGEVMKADPHRWRTLNGIGILFAMKGKYDEAISYFQQALNESPDSASVLNNAALTYAIDKQFDRSYEYFNRAKARVETDSAEMKHLDLNLALVYAVDGKVDEAQEVAAPHPQQGRALQQHGLLFVPCEE